MEDQEILRLLNQRHSGFNIHCGISFLEASTGRVVAGCPLEERHLNPMGFAHGGLIAALMDVAAGGCSLFAHGHYRPSVTQSAEIHYLRPVKGERLLAEGICLKAGRRSAVVRVELRVEGSDKVCAVGDFELCYLDV